MPRLNRARHPLPFVPTNLASLQCYLRDDLGVTLASGKVATWADQSGNGLDFTQGTAGNQPTFTAGGQNGHGRLVFAGGQWLNRAANTIFATAGFTAFVVGKSTSAAAAQYISQTAGGTNGPWFIQDTGAGSPHGLDLSTVNAVPTRVNTAPQTDQTSVFLGEFFYDGSNNNIWKNGVALTPGAQTGTLTSSSQPITIGALNNSATQPLTGELYAILLFNRALSGGERAEVRTFLNALYAIY